MRHPELVGADLDPPALVPETSALPRKGHSALGLGFRKDVMLRLYHAFLGLRNRPQPLTGKGCLLHKQKNPHRTADGTLRVRITTAGGLSPRYRASREDITLARGSNTFDPYVRGCAAHGVILLTGHTRRLTIPAAKQRRRLAVCTYLRGFLGWHVGSIEIDPYGSRAGFPSGEPMHV